MGISSFFKKKSTENGSVCEASGTDIDTSFKKGTIRDNLPDIFRGMTSGTMVAPALKSGKIPYWEGCDITYPFVGISGYSTHSAVSVANRRERGYINDFFSRLMSDSRIRSALSAVMKNGFPSNSYIFYPNVPINSVGSGYSSRSTSVFFPTVMSKAVQSKLGNSVVQQCLNIDSNGNLFVDETKIPTTVFYPVRGTSKHSALGISKITLDDVIGVITNMGGKKALVDMLVAAFRSYVSIQSNIHSGNAPSPNEHMGSNDAYNKDAWKFFDFFKSINPKLDDAMLIKYAKENPNALVNSFVKWLDANDVRTICEKLVTRYFFPCPFENTYCMRRVEDISTHGGFSPDDVRRDFEVYRKCMEEANEDTLKSLLQKEQNNDGSSSGTESQAASTATIDESGMLDAYDMKDSLMKICRAVSSGTTSRKLFCLTIRSDAATTTREDGTEITRHEGIKRIFIRILTSTSGLNGGEDAEFLEDTTDKFVTSPFKLDFTELFNRFPNQLDSNAKQTFSCYRVSGYAVTFGYDQDVESSADGSSNEYIEQLYAAYKKGGNRITEPASFSLSYFIDEDFISSEYGAPTSEIISMGGQKIPQSLRNDRYGVTEDRIRSHFIYSNKRVNLINKDNAKIVKLIPKRRSIDKPTKR